MTTQSVEFKIAYDGSALQDHSMNVRDLAPALLSLGQLFDEANRILNGSKVTINLQIKAHEAGSFEVWLQLYQSVKEQVSQFLTGDFVVSVLNLKELILGGISGAGGLIWLIKKLKGEKPDRIEDLKDGTARIEFAHETFIVPIELLRFYQSIVIRQSVENILKPLQEKGIDRFEIKENGITLEQISKDEIAFFNTPPVEDEIFLTSETEAAYSIISLTFKDDNKWRLHDGNTIISATISDQDFQNRVANNEISFAKGDILRCRIRTTTWRTKEGLKTECEVLKVLKHVPAASQLNLHLEIKNDEK